MQRMYWISGVFSYLRSLMQRARYRRARDGQEKGQEKTQDMGKIKRGIVCCWRITAGYFNHRMQTHDYDYACAL